MRSPPEKEGRLCSTVLKDAELLGAYHVAKLLARTFGLPFWFFEQWCGKLADRIANEGLEL